MNVANCQRAINLVDKYVSLLKINQKHLNNLDHICMIITNIISCFDYNKDDRTKSGFYCYSYSKQSDDELYNCINLQGDGIICREYSFNKYENYSYEDINIDYLSDFDGILSSQ